MKKEARHNFFFLCPTFVWDQNLFIIFLLGMIFFHKLHYHIQYEEFYWYKKLQKFNINILITLACPQFQNIQIYPGLGQLGVTRALVNEEENVILARISFIKHEKTSFSATSELRFLDLFSYFQPSFLF